MGRTAYEKIMMKFNKFQLDNVIIALLDHCANKKFVSNVNSLFKIFKPESYENDLEKACRIYLIEKMCTMILTDNIQTRGAILNLIDIDGRYGDASTDVLNHLVDMSLDAREMAALDRLISLQLRYHSVENRADALMGKLTDLRSENYEDLETHIDSIASAIDVISRDLRDAKESIEDAKKDMSLSSSAFGNVLGNIIAKERNPSSKVKTGVQFLNSMLNGGWERSRLYCALGVAKG